MADEPDQPEKTEKTVRERMEALGWSVAYCEDTCGIGWVKIDAGRNVTAYGHESRFQRDLEDCQREFGYLDGKTAY
jgi:hypothetical protein